MLITHLKAIFFIGSLAILGGLLGCKKEQDPVEVRSYEMGTGEKIEITAIADEITITNIEVNRGNCGNGIQSIINNKYASVADAVNAIKEHKLKFGQKLYVPVYNCTVKEVSITTDQGDYTFTFDE